ncbi:MAG: late competence development ComFB family protein [Peptococcaceae bacterium]|jgi:hypothetical protein|nr:late competence development ComFB family protein [Peptococcaceae bacterium]
MAKTKSDLDKDLMFSKIMPVFAEHLQNQAAQAENPAAGLEPALFAAEKPEADNNTAAIHNIMEHLVLRHVDEAIQKFNCCRCDRCRRDIVAYALSLLPAKYVVTNRQSAEKIKAAIPRKEIFDALVKAAIKVRANPRH